MQEYWQIWIDTGGTFTDCLAQSPEGDTRRLKVLSSSCLRGTLTAVHTPTEIDFSLSQPIPAQFALGQGLRLLGQSTEPIAITEQSTEQSLRLAKPLPEGTALGQAIEIVFDMETPILAARLATGTIAS